MSGTPPQDTARLLELTQRALAGETLSAAERRELETAGITVSQPAATVADPTSLEAQDPPTADGAHTRAAAEPDPAGAAADPADVDLDAADAAEVDAAEGPGRRDAVTAAAALPEVGRPAARIVVDLDDGPEAGDRPRDGAAPRPDSGAGDATPTCASCGHRLPGGDRFCRSCGTPVAEGTADAPASAAVHSRSVLTASPRRAGGVLDQVAALDPDQMRRIVDEAGRTGPAFDDAQERVEAAATRAEATGIEYCYRTIRQLMTWHRGPGGQLAGSTLSDEVAVAKMGTAAALSYLRTGDMTVAEREALRGPWVRAVGEPPEAVDLVTLAVDDHRSRREDWSLPAVPRDPTDPGLRNSVASFSPRAQPGPATRPSTSSSASPSSRATPRYVGDAGIGDLWSVRQVFDAACWVIAGIAMIVLALQPETSSGWVVVIGIAGVLYGLRILFGGGSYWVSSWVYVIAFFAVVVTFGAIF